MPSAESNFEERIYEVHSGVGLANRQKPNSGSIRYMHQVKEGDSFIRVEPRIELRL